MGAGLPSAWRCSEGESRDRGDLDPGASQHLHAEGNPAPIHADRGEPVLFCLDAEFYDFWPGRFGLEQRVIYEVCHSSRSLKIARVERLTPRGELEIRTVRRL